MPRNRASKSKRTPWKRKRHTKVSLYRSPKATGAPSSMNVKLKYSDKLFFNPTTLLQEQVYAGNSVYDPDVSSIGGQPLARDEFTALYNRYRVNGSSIKIRAVSNEGTIAGVVGLYPQVTNTGPVNLLEAIEQSKSQYRILQVLTGGKGQASIKDYRSTAGMLGISKAAAKSKTNLQSIVGSDPTDKWYWRIFTQGIDEATLCNMYVIVELTYYVTYFDKKVLNRS